MQWQFSFTFCSMGIILWPTCCPNRAQCAQIATPCSLQKRFFTSPCSSHTLGSCLRSINGVVIANVEKVCEYRTTNRAASDNGMLLCVLCVLLWWSWNIYNNVSVENRNDMFLCYFELKPSRSRRCRVATRTWRTAVSPRRGCTRCMTPRSQSAPTRLRSADSVAAAAAAAPQRWARTCSNSGLLARARISHTKIFCGERVSQNLSIAWTLSLMRSPSA